MSSSSAAAQTKPTSGETSKDEPTSFALTQFTPSPNSCPFDNIEFARPTPMMEPMSACELEAGSPKYQVPRFQIMAAIRRAHTIAKPAPDPTLSTNSTGSNASTPNATAPLEVKTPIKFQQPDQTTATIGLRLWGSRQARA